MKNSLKVFAIAIFASLLLAMSAIAQTSTTGTVEGTVTDSNGAVVPGATVTLSGGGLLRPQTATSDNDGVYRFLQIPPGKYSVKIEASSGFAAYTQENVEVNLGKSSTVSISLKPASVGAVVDVVASPDIDPTSNVTGSNISSDFFSNIPTARTVQSLYNIAPTVARSGLRDASGRDRDPSVAGSSGPENNYILDGVNTTDPAFGGGGSNIPFDFVQEVQIQTGNYGANQGLSTGGVFNVITKAGTNDYHGDLFAYIGSKNLVRDTKNFPLTGLAPSGFSEVDAGGDFSGPIIKNRLTFFVAFNPQRRENTYLTQTFRTEVTNKITTPFYSGKLTWLVNNNNTFTFSTFGDFTKQEGHLFPGSGFGANEASFQGLQETGGTNYAFRLNSNLAQNWIGEFSFGLHKQRNNVIPDAAVANTALISDTFAILRANGTVAPITHTAFLAGVTPTTVPTPGTNTGFVDYVYSPGGSLQRNFIQDGFGLFQDQTRDRWEFAARLQNIWNQHTFKYGFEFYKNKYDINQTSTGPSGTFANPLLVGTQNGSNPDNITVSGYRVANNWLVCTTRGTQIVCPVTQAASGASNGAGILSGLGVLPAGITSVVVGPITAAEALNNPFLVRATTRVRDFKLIANTTTSVESFYIQDDWKITKDLQLNVGARWDYQQAYGNGGVTYLKLNNWFDNLQPRVGLIWDFTGKGKGKFFANVARYVETPLPLDINVRAGSNDTQTDKNFNVNLVNAPLTATVATGFVTRNLGAESTPIDENLKPQTVNEFTMGFEYEVKKDYTFGVRGIYRPQGSVIEDGSFDDGGTYFLFNPGEPLGPGPGGQFGNTEYKACNDATVGCFGRARRFYRALEFTFNKRFTNHYSFQSSYVYSSLIGNYEGLFRNDNGQSDPNITSLFDLVSLLGGAYGRLPNDRPHQFKFNGNYQLPFKLMLSGNFYIQSGIPFNQLIPHPVYGNNEGFGVPRGTAIIPDLGANSAGVTSAVGTTRTPTTYNLDIGVYYPIKFSETMQLRLTADWFNVTNTQRAVTLDQTFSINSGVAGVAPVANPFFGSGTIFQFPSALRLGAKFSF
ncbi:MAG TPA: TonB-dependent receptor [Pyrinomonadaceae bacterium]|jgi:outer membrane receptor protein involved in Fe transport|nr:TonB-dependent receptor [Pyrinomonadaceae bacterium]